MSVLNQIATTLLTSQLGKQTNENEITSLATDLLSKDGSSGNIDLLLTALKSSGLSDKVSSWVGSGENEPVTEEEIEKCVDKSMLDSIAEKTGIDKKKMLPILTALLPVLVDKMTPEGKEPPDNTMLTLGTSLLSKFL